MPEVIIIGGGPAGAVAGLALASRGRDVLIVEQHRFPRDKVCGECLSSLGIEVLERLGVAETLKLLCPIRLTRTILHAPGGATAELPLPRPMWGLSRRVMDAALLDAARNAGAEILQPARCESIREGSHVGAIVRDLGSNALTEIRSKLLLLADGKGGLLPQRPRPTRDFGLKAHFTNVAGPADAIELFGVAGHYGGIAPIEGGLWNVAFNVPADRLAENRGNLDGLLARMVAENSGLARRFARAARVGDWLASPLPRFAVAGRWPRGIIPIGNAAAALEPVGGEGMGLAMRSAELAAEAIEQSFAIGRPLAAAALRHQFARLWRLRRAACRGLAMMMSRPGVAEFTVSAAAASESLSRAMMTCMGKA